MTTIYKTFRYPDLHFRLFHDTIRVIQNDKRQTLFYVMEGISPEERLKIADDLLSLFTEITPIIRPGGVLAWEEPYTEDQISSHLLKCGFYRTQIVETSPVYLFQYNASPQETFVLVEYTNMVFIGVASDSLEDHLLQTLSRFSPYLEGGSICLPFCTAKDLKDFLLRANFFLISEDIAYRY